MVVWGTWWHVVAFVTLAKFNYLDFGRFYYAMRSWREGASLYDPSVATWLTLPTGEGMHLWNLNSPHVSLLFWPLSFASVEHAYLTWMLISFFCLAFSAQMIVDTLGLRLPRSTLALVAAFVFAATPTISYAGTGNVTGPVTLLTTWIWTEWRSRRVSRAAVGIGIAWSAKLFFLPLLVYLACKRQWRAVGLAGAVGVAMYGIGLLVFGWPEHVRWLQAISGVQWPWLTINSSIIAPFARVAYVGNGESVAAPQIATAVRIGMVAAAALGFVGLLTATLDESRDRGMLILLLTCLLASPLGWLYYWWTFAGPLVACMPSKVIRWSFWISLPGWFTPMYFLWPYETVWFAATLGSVYTWSLSVLWCGCAVSAWKPPLISWRQSIMAIPKHLR